VGGTLKRTADRLVAEGHDISDAQDLDKALRETNTSGWWLRAVISAMHRSLTKPSVRQTRTMKCNVLG
jgi:hypothetical protein